jgi:molecular chaperone GrpE
LNKKQKENEQTKKVQEETTCEKNAQSQAAATIDENNSVVQETQNSQGEPSQNVSEAKQPNANELLKIYLEQSFAEIKRLNTALEAAQKEAENFETESQQLKDKLASNVAEYENFRRRTAAEKEGIFAEAVVKSAVALLPALDSLERSMCFACSNTENFIQGVEMTLRQLICGFSSLGVAEIEAQGAKFNPEIHNAVMHVQDESLGESVVAEVFEKGYVIGDKVIRHSMVKVAN